MPFIQAMQQDYKLPEPQEGFQRKFLESKADITVAGGAAGSGKSASLLLKTVRDTRTKGFGAVIFRITAPEITNEGGLWDESIKMYGQIPGAVSRESRTDWIFPNGSAISFGHADKLQQKYPGAQICAIGIDELTYWKESDFWFLLSRNRSTCGVKPRIDATCNPDADSWVAKLVEWWIDQETGYPIPERDGVLRYFYRIQEQMHWADTPEQLESQFPDLAAIAPPKSLTFIKGSIYENKALLDANPQYLSSLLALHPVLMERLLKGNWKVKLEAGTIFARGWFQVVDSVPEFTKVVRFWDFAATDKARATKTTSYTASAKWCVVGDTYYILDITANQLSPDDGNAAVESIAIQDGLAVKVRWELEGGSAGLRFESMLKSLLSGFDARGIKPMGDKKTRAMAWAILASTGKIKLLRAAWNDQFLSAVSQFDGSHIPLVNDIIDACSGASAELQTKVEYQRGSASVKRR